MFVIVILNEPHNSVYNTELYVIQYMPVNIYWIIYKKYYFLFLNIVLIGLPRAMFMVEFYDFWNIQSNSAVTIGWVIYIISAALNKSIFWSTC